MWWISSLAAVTYLTLLVSKSLLALREYRRQCALDVRKEMLARPTTVAIIQPILSGDPLLPQVLQKNAESLRDQASLFWAVDDNDHVAQEIVDSLQAAFDHVHVLICPRAAAAINPKLYKMQWVLDRLTSEFQYLVVLDDDTILSKESLQIAIANVASRSTPLEHRPRDQQSRNSETGVAIDNSAVRPPRLFTGLPHYARGQNVWSNLVASFVNNNSALTYLPLLGFLPPVSINGMFYVVPLTEFRAIGGFRPVESWLCDDYAVKQHVSRHGWHVEQGIATATVQTRIRDGRHYLQQMHRWMIFGRLLLESQPTALRIVLAAVLALPSLLLLVAVSLAWMHWISLAVLGVVLCLRWAMLRGLSVAVFGRSLLQPGLSLVAELLQPWHVLHSLVQQTIQWRTHRIVARAADAFEIVG